MKIYDLVRRLDQEKYVGDVPVVLVVAALDQKLTILENDRVLLRGEVIDVQPCLWDPETDSVILIDDRGDTPQPPSAGFVCAVALLTKGAS